MSLPEPTWRGQGFRKDGAEDVRGFRSAPCWTGKVAAPVSLAMRPRVQPKPGP